MIDITISGLTLDQLTYHHPIFGGLQWHGQIPPSYSIHVTPNSQNTGGIIACADSFGGGVAWAEYQGVQKLKSEGRALDADELDYLAKNYPDMHEALTSLS